MTQNFVLMKCFLEKDVNVNGECINENNKTETSYPGSKDFVDKYIFRIVSYKYDLFMTFNMI